MIGVSRCCSRWKRYGYGVSSAMSERSHSAITPLVAIAVLPARHLDPGAMHLVGDAVRRHHLERRRMEGAGAQIVGKRGFRLEHEHRHVAARQRERGKEADRAGAGDDHARRRHRSTRRRRRGRARRAQSRRRSRPSTSSRPRRNRAISLPGRGRRSRSRRARRAAVTAAAGTEERGRDDRSDPERDEGDPHAKALSVAAARSSASPNTSGATKPAPKPSVECTAIVAPRKAGSLAATMPAVSVEEVAHDEEHVRDDQRGDEEPRQVPEEAERAGERAGERHADHDHPRAARAQATSFPAMLANGETRLATAWMPAARAAREPCSARTRGRRPSRSATEQLPAVHRVAEDVAARGPIREHRPEVEEMRAARAPVGFRPGSPSMTIAPDRSGPTADHANAQRQPGAAAIPLPARARG